LFYRTARFKNPPDFRFFSSRCAPNSGRFSLIWNWVALFSTHRRIEGVQGMWLSRTLPVKLWKGEELAYRGRLHRIIIVSPFVAFTALLCILRILANPELKALAMVGTIIAGLWLIYSTVNFMISDLIITNYRVVVQAGLLGRRTLDITLSQIEQISVQQGTLGEFLGFGSITLKCSGGREERFHRVAAPVALKKKALGQMFTEANSPQDNAELSDARP
jgi:hypothetical protein